MAELDLGLVKGEKGDPFTYADFTSEQLQALKGDKGDIGVTPTIKAGTATSLDATAAPTVTATTVGTTTTFDFGIPKGDISTLETPTFDDTTSTYNTLTESNTAAETSSNAIKSKTSIFTTLSNMKKSFSAIVQGLKILGTNVGAITGITSDLAGESETVAASIKCVNELNSSLSNIGHAGILFQGACGTDTVITNYAISNFKFIRLELLAGKQILNSVTIDKSEFVTEGFGLRSHWNDMSNVYYQDISYVSDNSIRVTCNDNAVTAGLSFRVIGTLEL